MNVFFREARWDILEPVERQLRAVNTDLLTDDRSKPNYRSEPNFPICCTRRMSALVKRSRKTVLASPYEALGLVPKRRIY